jgi:photosystem II biogenesis protein Psp29
MGITIILDLPVSTVRTVSDTKRAFYSLHTRPINSIYRRVVEELMVEMHLLSVNADFSYNPIYGLGVFTTFERFMQGYRPETDYNSIFNALCQSLPDDPQKYRRDAAQMRELAASTNAEEFLAQVKQLPEGAGSLLDVLRPVATHPSFKYSRLFAIGLYNLLEIMNPELVQDEAKRNEALQGLANSLKLSDDKMQKDLELYRGNLEKLAQVRQVMEDILKADRKKKEERAKAKDLAATPPQDSASA